RFARAAEMTDREDDEEDEKRRAHAEKERARERQSWHCGLHSGRPPLPCPRGNVTTQKVQQRKQGPAVTKARREEAGLPPFVAVRARNGFTLIELMVVLVIIGLAAAAVMLALPEAGGSLAGEADRFAARARAARDTAILDSRAVALQVGSGGYEVARRE